MIRSSKILWGEGLFLRPQHFQRQDAYHEWRLSEAVDRLHPYAWGIHRMEADDDALKNGTLRFHRLELVFSDGEVCCAPEEDDLPEPYALGALAAGVSELMVYAALPPMRPSATNFNPEDASAPAAVRFVQRNEMAGDLFTNAGEAQVSTLRRRLRLVTNLESLENLTTLPLCRVRRTGTSAFEIDAQFVPPVMHIAAAPALQSMLRRLLDILQAKVDALYGVHREPSKHVSEFRSGDIASFWLLHTASSAYASLSHLHHHGGLHPERLYERLLELAGALMTFSRSHKLADLRRYDHDEPGPAFEHLDQVIRDLLETVISTRYFAIALNELKPSYYQGRLDSQKIDPATTLYLGVQATLPPAELVEAVPQRFKVGAPDDVEKLVLSAMSGVRIVHAPQVPAAIPVRPGAYYFAIEPRGPLYERMLQSKSITLYVPSGIPDLRLELFALTA